jgi:hypothetical protein
MSQSIRELLDNYRCANNTNIFATPGLPYDSNSVNGFANISMHDGNFVLRNFLKLVLGDLNQKLKVTVLFWDFNVPLFLNKKKILVLIRLRIQTECTKN